MQKYEIMAILENSFDAKAAEQYAQTSIAQRIEKEFDGKITYTDFWGERGFAYQINKQKWGYYVVFQFEMEGTKTMELRHELNLDQKIVRFLVSKIDKRAGEPRKYSDMKAEYEAQEKKKGVDKKEAPKVNTKKEKLTTIKEVSKKTEEAPKKEEAKKDAVDKKLDAIIDESSASL